jgi:hypothetical protein
MDILGWPPNIIAILPAPSALSRPDRTPVLPVLEGRMICRKKAAMVARMGNMRNSQYEEAKEKRPNANWLYQGSHTCRNLSAMSSKPAIGLGAVIRIFCGVANTVRDGAYLHHCR